MATGNHYPKGQRRLIESPHLCAETMIWTKQLPHGSPKHSQINYAFKAHALMAAKDRGYSALMW